MIKAVPSMFLIILLLATMAAAQPVQDHLAKVRQIKLTVATDPENDVLTYNYVVSAGKIVGVGAKVIWDLNGIKAGAYTIRVGVDDGMGILGKTVTKTVIVK